MSLQDYRTNWAYPEFSSGFTVNSIFYTSKIFPYAASKDTKTNELKISFKGPSQYFLKISKQNIKEAIMTEESELFLKLHQRPLLESSNFRGRMSRSSYEVLLNDDSDEITKILFPHFLTLKLKKGIFFELILNTIVEWKIPVESGFFIEENWTSRPCYSNIFENPSIDSSVKYTLLCFLTNSLMQLEDLNQRTIESVSQASEKSISDLFHSNQSLSSKSLNIFRNSQKNLESRFNQKKPESRFQIKKVFITPSSIIFHPPSNEIGNRVIRKYSELTQLFLRVSFTEEDLEKRNWATNNLTTSRFRSFLDSLRILDLEYEFLGFSGSQIKSHSCWMIVKTADSWADQIRESLGDFTGCKTIAKYSARLGLCFSETQKTLKVHDSSIEEIPDVERNGYIFSDGIGMISPEYLLEARHILKVSDDEEICAVQIRLAGCKGVLVLAPELENSIKIRPSMCKFVCNERELEVCNFAKYKRGFLNRQIILLLHGLGVHEQVFIRMQEKEVNDARKMLQEDIDQVYRKVKEKGIITDYRTLTQGIQDQFFFYQKTLRIMQLKARIPVKKSALLMGVMDEYRTLGPKEVYIRISKDGKSTVVEGPVVVAKNPCLHPGDIRLLTAVNYPQIAHLVNVVVFSQLGERPAPHMCSGSDLDGDEYFVTWKSKLTNIREEYPLDYVSEDGRQYEALNVEKVKDYFVDYMRYDSLGKIANLHALFADLHGIMASDALYYAEKHAKAVDYPKTGIKIFESSSVSEWPDFLERGYLPSYKSPGILGKLYRNLNGFIERTEGFSYRTLDM